MTSTPNPFLPVPPSSVVLNHKQLNFALKADVDPYAIVARRPASDVIFRVEKLRY